MKTVLKALRYLISLNEKKQEGLAGQGFTEYTCSVCDTTKVHPNTNTPIFCKECEFDIHCEIQKIKSVDKKRPRKRFKRRGTR